MRAIQHTRMKSVRQTRTSHQYEQFDVKAKDVLVFEEEQVLNALFAVCLSSIILNISEK